MESGKPVRFRRCPATVMLAEYHEHIVNHEQLIEPGLRLHSQVAAVTFAEKEQSQRAKFCARALFLYILNKKFLPNERKEDCFYGSIDT